MNQIVYLVRHCQATGQEPDAPLTETGQQQAIALADWLSEAQITRIISSPYVRAYQSIVPLAKRLRLTIEVDDRLIERVLCSTPLNHWQEKLAETFVDLDLSFAGGESSRVAMSRGMAVVDEVIHQSESSVAIVTHGNLMALILKRFDEQIGYAEWANLRNPDVYRVQIGDGLVQVGQFSNRQNQEILILDDYEKI
ncbi:MAG: histidine phosphatase family protein [Elainella sp. C42_A2020_010]|nr:histidine phosphatase family protein [Elainella sp. C42_A2020_010]